MYQPHELALIFPPMAAEQYEDLKRDIAAHGLRDPITLLDDQVLDGVHRQRACEETGTAPTYVTFAADDDATSFVTSRNLTRRHLSFQQRAELALNLLPHYQDEAKQRQTRHGQTAPGRTLTPDPAEVSGEAMQQAATAVGLGKTTVREAKRIKEEDPDLWADTVAGKHSVDGAGRKLRQRKGEQPAPKNRGDRAENWNGKTNPKRGRELREHKKTGNYADLVRTQLQINQLCSALEATTLEDFALEDATLAVIADIHDDLITLAEWTDRKLHHVSAWLDDVSVRDKIKRLRNTTGRTSEEAATAQRLADRLERKLEARLTA